MKLTRANWKFTLAPALAIALGVQAAEAQAPAEGGVPVRVTVTATAKNKASVPRLSKDDFLVYQEKERRRILSAVPQQGDENKLDLLIVIDEAIDNAVSLNYQEVSAFVRELPSPVRVGVLYALNGTVTIAQDVTSDREAALKQLRLPLGRIGAGGGIYLSLADLAKRLPPDPGRRRAIFFLSSGIDAFRGISDTSPGLNFDLETAIKRLQRNGINVYSIYVTPAAHFYRNLFLVSNGQSCLSRLAAETGGEAFFQGFQTPISMKPFLEEMADHLNNQFVVTFAAKPLAKPGYARFRVTTEVGGVELEGPSLVYVPAAQ